MIAAADNQCPICGRQMGDPMTRQPHHCPPATLRGIDGAETRARNTDPDGIGNPIEGPRFVGQRLGEGFGMMRDDDPME